MRNQALHQLNSRFFKNCWAHGLNHHVNDFSVADTEILNPVLKEILETRAPLKEFLNLL